MQRPSWPATWISSGQPNLTCLKQALSVPPQTSSSRLLDLSKWHLPFAQAKTLESTFTPFLFRGMEPIPYT